MVKWLPVQVPILSTQVHSLKVYEFEFPIHTFWIKGEKQSHRSKRCVKYDWLHYDSMADAGFCHLCLTTKRDNSFLAGMKRDPAFISRRIPHQSRRRY